MFTWGHAQSTPDFFKIPLQTTQLSEGGELGSSTRKGIPAAFLRNAEQLHNSSQYFFFVCVISNLYGVYIPYITFRTRDQKGIMTKLSTQDCLSKQEEQHSFNHFHSGRSAQCGTHASGCTCGSSTSSVHSSLQ